MSPRADALRGRPIFLNTLAFAVAFAAWIMFGPSVRLIAGQFGLSASQATLLEAIPILTAPCPASPWGSSPTGWAPARPSAW